MGRNATQTGEQGVADEATRIRGAGHEQATETAAAGARPLAPRRRRWVKRRRRPQRAPAAVAAATWPKRTTRSTTDLRRHSGPRSAAAAVQAQIGMLTHGGQATATVQETGEQAAATVEQEAGVLHGRSPRPASGLPLSSPRRQRARGQQLRRHGFAAVRRLAGAAATARQAVHARADEARSGASASAAALVTGLAEYAQRAMASSTDAQASAARHLRNLRQRPADAAATAAPARRQMLDSHAGAIDKDRAQRPPPAAPGSGRCTPSSAVPCAPWHRAPLCPSRRADLGRQPARCSSWERHDRRSPASPSRHVSPATACSARPRPASARGSAGRQRTGRRHLRRPAHLAERRRHRASERSEGGHGAASRPGSAAAGSADVRRHTRAAGHPGRHRRLGR